MKDVAYAPWRDEYINDKQIKGCVFCHISDNSEKARDLHVLYRSENYFIVMNKYPYTPGHFMIIPHHHTSALEELDPAIWLEMTAQAQKGVAMLKEVLNAQGVNIGMNLGHAGGAGIAEHVHLHLVPRWEKDTNFMTSVGHTRVYSTDFQRIFEKLLEAVPRYFN